MMPCPAGRDAYQASAPERDGDDRIGRPGAALRILAQSEEGRCADIEDLGG